MERRQFYYVIGLVVAVFGGAIVAGGLLGSVGVPTGMGSDDLLIGAGIAVAGAGAALSVRHSPVEEPVTAERIGR